MRFGQRGFSLVEMAVVGAILGIIVAVAAPALRSDRDLHVAQGRRFRSAYSQMMRAQAKHRAQFGKYAVSLGELGLTSSETDRYQFALVGTRATREPENLYAGRTANFLRESGRSGAREFGRAAGRSG
jgi:prepilin-type N-terminal cleavage/methylation domain-containing protein